MGTLCPLGIQFFTDAGAVAASYQLFTYFAGSSTKQPAYTSSALTSAHTNPIVLNSAGRPTSPIFLAANSYKFVLAPANDTDPPASPIWTIDNVSALAPFDVAVDIDGTAGENLSARDAVYLSDGSGARTAGRWYKIDADFDYGSTEAKMIGFAPAAITSASSGSIRISGRVTGFAGLTAGSTYYASATDGAITTTAPTLAQVVAVADSTTSVVITPAMAGRIAYATGIGGTVTQATSKTTGVTLHKRSGQITMNNAALGAGAEATFTVTNQTVEAGDVIVACHGATGTSGAYFIAASNIVANAFDLTVTNVTGGSLSEAIVINFVVIKTVAA